MNRTVLQGILAVLIPLLLGACADSLPVAYDSNRNFLVFNHPFTEQAIADVAARAERLCRQRKQVAVQTAKACTLNNCTTTYQCEDAADVERLGL